MIKQMQRALMGFCVGCALLVGTSCATGLYGDFSLREHRQLDRMIRDNPVFEQGFTGFVLVEPGSKTLPYSYNGNRTFTPASNTKILTAIAALHLLPDTLPALVYSYRGDTLVFSGTGHPGFLHPDFPDLDNGFQLLQKHSGPIAFSATNFTDQPYGQGWMWDDYPYAWQPARSSMPIYGNTATFFKYAGVVGVKGVPTVLGEAMRVDFSLNNDRPRVSRAWNSNDFTVNAHATASGSAFERAIPFVYSDADFVDWLSDTLGRAVHLATTSLNEPTEVLYEGDRQQLLAKMMHDSDNFLAEQLLLMCGWQLEGELNTAIAIRYTLDNLLPAFEPPVRWRDGAGLSRYNAVSPAALARMLNQLYTTMDWETLKTIFPTGGVEGTIKNWYGGSPPYIWAKTGTMTGVHCLSGYLETRSGRILSFSFMHNQHPFSSQRLKPEMQRILEWVREAY